MNERMGVNRNKKTIKCKKCNNRNYLILDEVYLNEHEQRCIICAKCNKEIVLKK